VPKGKITLLVCLDGKPQHGIELSGKALRELKAIVQSEVGTVPSDMELREMGIRLLELFDILLKPGERQNHISVSKEEFQVLKIFINAFITTKKQPTVRGIGEAARFHSPRSGLRLLNRLVDRGLLFRDPSGDIQMRSDVGVVPSCMNVHLSVVYKLLVSNGLNRYSDPI
jgi:hypothetical protein